MLGHSDFFCRFLDHKVYHYLILMEDILPHNMTNIVFPDIRNGKRWFHQYPKKLQLVMVTGQGRLSEFILTGSSSG